MVAPLTSLGRFKSPVLWLRALVDDVKHTWSEESGIMLGIVAALLGAATPACTPVPGSSRLWESTIRWVIVGEMHGTNESPDAFANLICLAAATGRPVTVALEYTADE